MMSFKNTLGLLLLAILAMVAESSWGNGGENSYSYDLSKMSDIRKLYNSKVFNAERMTRPMEEMFYHVGKLSHSGVRVTLEDGTKWLVHKGNRYGVSSQTVVVDARHMSNEWKIVETKDFRGSKTVSDLAKAGGTDYKLLFDNCHDAADRMMDG